MDNHDGAYRLMPTHSCFDDAMEFLGMLALHFSHQLNEVSLMHGLCKFDDGSLGAHAWVFDHEGYVIQAGMLNTKRVYYRVSKADFHRCWFPTEDVTVYSPKSASDENYRTGTYGPWVERYQARCGAGARQVWRLPSPPPLIALMNVSELVALSLEMMTTKQGGS